MSFEATGEMQESMGLDIAVVGMSVRFPGAKNTAEFWHNLREGIESISFFSEAELEDAGVERAKLRAANYVKASAVLGDADKFDASFFGIYPREAELIDPQQRVFLECAWEALEDAGYNPDKFAGLIGVFAGSGINSYLINNILADRELFATLDPYQVVIQNDKDFLATRVSYKLNLRGPSIVVQTACSTSLVAFHLACQSLLNYQCDMALSGGVTIRVPEKNGYLYQEGGVVSPDGHCRAFDAEARGTVGGSGAGIVVLKRLEDALSDGDSIHAVIKGSAVNNDGALKVGFTAPGVDGQAEVIAAAHAVAQVESESIGYVEAHGTGTVLGDPIEIAALTQAFGASGDKKNFCAVGSVKTNVGHLDAAAGIAGLIKTVLALEHKQIPPSLHFNEPNPAINFVDSPFFVNATLREWKSEGGVPRRAGVSSFGMGGTNAHVVLEEPPAVVRSDDARDAQLLLLSARTEQALEQVCANLSDHLRLHPDTALGDVAFTLQTGRKFFAHCRSVVCRTADEAAKLLAAPASVQTHTNAQTESRPSVVFMFPGQGSQYVGMGRYLYRTYDEFRSTVERCADVLKPKLGFDLRDVLYPAASEAAEAERRLKQTAVTQPALFVIEYAAASLLMKLGINPQAMIGHSIGEYVAACLAGVMSLDDALSLVARRGELMQELPAGAMLAVSLTERDLQPYMREGVSVAALNAPAQCVVSGSFEAIEDLERRLAEERVVCRRVNTSHAFHSSMMQPVLERFAAHLRGLQLHAPRLPYMSNLTGTWITAEQAADPAYWVEHLRETVRFSENIGAIVAAMPDALLLEVGPGRTLKTLAKRHLTEETTARVVSALPHDGDEADDEFFLRCLGELWGGGLELDWSPLRKGARRVSLPTYPFERRRYWIEPRKAASETKTDGDTASSKNAIEDWFYVPLWKQTLPPTTSGNRGLAEVERRRWLVFADKHGLGSDVAGMLARHGHEVVRTVEGSEFAMHGAHSYSVNPERDEDYKRLFDELRAKDLMPDTILHLWSVEPETDAVPNLSSFEEAQRTGFYSLLRLVQAVVKAGETNNALQLCVVTSNAQLVTGDERLQPERVTATGLCRVIPQEHPHISCRTIDIALPAAEGLPRERLASQLILESAAHSPERSVAYRGGRRWVQEFENVRLHDSSAPHDGLRENGVYLITGGLGGIGLLIAGHIARSVKGRLVLAGRTALPARDEWETWLRTHDAENAVSQKIEAVRALERLGAEVTVVGADVSDAEQMRALFSRISERYGALHGVVHAAGLVGQQWLKGIEQTRRADADAHFRAKARGLLVLEEQLRDKQPDFCILFSSVSSILGGLAFAAYASANAFLDAFAQRQNSTNGTRWLSVDWDGWQLHRKTPANGARVNQSAHALSPEEGVEAFRRLFALGDEIPQVVISTSDLNARIRRWVKLERQAGTGRTDAASSSGGASGVASSDTESDADGRETVATARHARPHLRASFVAPRNETEQALAQIWTEALGIGGVGVNDDFFELGGDSLLATQIVARLRREFDAEISIQNFFEQPTVGGLASVIARLQTERRSHADESELELLQMLEQLSEEEIEAELNKRMHVAARGN